MRIFYFKLIYPDRFKQLLCSGIYTLFLCIAVLCVNNSHALIEYRSAPPETYRETWKQGNYQKALSQLEQQIKARPELAKVKAFRYFIWLSDRAEIQFTLGRVDKAIAILETITQYVKEPVFILRLAEYYRYRGRMDDYKQTLDLTRTQTTRRWNFFSLEQNYLAIGRLAELRGENPKILLSSLYTSLMENRPNFAGGFIGAGDLAFRKGAYGLAENYYLQALEIDGQNQDTLAGLAECYWKSSDSRLGEILDRLITLHPRNERAKSIQIEQYLDLGDPYPAMEIINERLELNPNHLHFLSLKTAALFLLDEIGKMQQIQQQVLEFNPHCSQVYRIPARIASRHYRFEEAVNMLRKALKIDPQDHQARAMYARDLLRLGKEDLGRKELEKAFDADPYNVHVFNMLNLLDSLDSFATIDKEPFVLRLPKNESVLLEKEAFSLLSEAYDLYQQKYCVELQTPVHVQIFDDHDDFMVRSVGLPGHVGFMGICFGRLITMDSPSARTGHAMNWHSVLWHEFVHVITLQKTKNRIPRWLSEGISVYEEKKLSPAFGQKMDLSYKVLIESEPLPGISELESYFIQPKTQHYLMLGYFLSAEFVDFYVNECGQDCMVDALEAIGQGEKAEKALLNSCQEEKDALNDKFKRHLKKRFAAFDNLPDIQVKPNPIQKLWDKVTNTETEVDPWIQQPSPFTNAMRRGTKALEEKRWEEAEHELKKAHELFPEYTAENAPLKQLIRLYELWGKQDKLKTTLRQEINWDPTDFSSYNKMISILEKEKAWDELIEVAQRALGIDPFDLDVRKILYHSLKKLNKKQEALDMAQQLSQLDSAHRLHYRQERITLLMQCERWDQAKKETIELLEEIPHYWEAQKLLLAIVERGNNTSRDE